MNRRQFLKNSAALAAGMNLSACISDRPQTARKEWFEISLAEWSLHRALFGGKLNHLDFAKTTRQDFGLDAVEYVNQFFKDKANDRPYLAEMNKRSRDYGVKNVLIMIDDEGDIGHATEQVRTKAVENHFKWVEAASILGCHAIRVNAYSTGSYQEQLDRCAEGLSDLAEFADQHGLNVLVENHGKLSSNGAWVADLMRKVNKPNCGTLPDFGNFDNDYDRYKGVAEMMPWAKGVSAKTHDFDAEGNETKTDFRRMLGIVKAAGYRGYIEAEYEGERLSEAEGVRATIRLLERVRAELT